MPPKHPIAIISGFSLAIVILGIVTAMSLHTIRDFVDGSRWVVHTHNVLANLEELLSLVKDAESGQRGFLITGESQYLLPYQSAIREIPIQLADLKYLTQDNREQQNAVDKINTLIQNRLVILNEGVQLKKDNADYAQLLMVLSRGNEVMMQLREHVKQMRVREKTLLEARSRRVEKDAELTNEVIITANIVALLILLMASWALVREFNKRKKAEEKFRAMLDFAPDAIVMVDKSGTIVLVNAQTERLFGYGREELYKKPVEILMPERYRRHHIGHRLSYADNAHFREMGQGLELFGRRKNGEEFPVEVSLSPFNADGSRLVSSAIRDITERKRSAQTLYQANQFLNSLIENIPNMIFVKDANTLRFVRFNKAGEHLLGYSREELINKNDYDFFPEPEADFFTAKDKAVLIEGRLVDIPEESIHTKFHGKRILHTMKIPLLDEHGVPQYLLGISEDITDRIYAEKEIKRLNDDLAIHVSQLEISNRELESFSYTVSHDLRAPLRAIDGFARMLQEDYSSLLDDQGRRWLSVIRDNSRRMGKLIDDLLAFSHLGRKSIDVVEFNMTALVQEVVGELQENNAQQGHLDILDLGKARGDPALIKQVWTNLLNNALKYSATQSIPYIEIFRTEKQGEIVYGVRDNGVGFDMQYYEKLFGVFERLHSTQEFSGTGVGLAIAQRIIVKHGGRIWAESQVNQGAAFYFTLSIGS